MKPTICFYDIPISKMTDRYYSCEIRIRRIKDRIVMRSFICDILTIRMQCNGKQNGAPAKVVGALAPCFCGEEEEQRRCSKDPQVLPASPFASELAPTWRRERDSNPRYAINVNTISSRAPSASSAISPKHIFLFIALSV